MIERLEGSGDSCRYRHSPQTRQYTGQAARTTRLSAPAGRAGSSHNRSDWRYCRLHPSACRLVRPKAAVHRHAASGSASFLGALSFATVGRFSARRQTRARPHVRDFIRGAAAVISVASARATTGSPSAAMAVTLKCVPSVTRIVPPAGLSARDRQILRRCRWISPASKPDGLSASRNPSGLQDWTKKPIKPADVCSILPVYKRCEWRRRGDSSLPVGGLGGWSGWIATNGPTALIVSSVAAPALVLGGAAGRVIVPS